MNDFYVFYNCNEISYTRYIIGMVYIKERYYQRNINKSVHYLTLAAEQNQKNAQFILGNIYIEGKYVVRDVDKGIHYLTLAATQNQIDARYVLGSIYFE